MDESGGERITDPSQLRVAREESPGDRASFARIECMPGDTTRLVDRDHVVVLVQYAQWSVGVRLETLEHRDLDEVAADDARTLVGGASVEANRPLGDQGTHQTTGEPWEQGADDGVESCGIAGTDADDVRAHEAAACGARSARLSHRIVCGRSPRSRPKCPWSRRATLNAPARYARSGGSMRASCSE